MWIRKDLKNQAKMTLKRNYWPAVAVCVVMLIFQMLTGSGGNVTSTVESNFTNTSESTTFENESLDQMYDSFESFMLSTTGTQMFANALNSSVIYFGFAILIIRLLMMYLITNPISAGFCSFFYKSRTEKTSIGEMAFAFNKAHYVPVVKTLFYRDIKIFLWSLLFVIPGIVKGYAYRMVPYIIAENPSISSQEALQLSEEMTRGYKWDLFLLDLSFFGWLLLGAVTLGLSDIFFTSPYIAATDAEAYAYLKQSFTKATSQDYVF